MASAFVTASAMDLDGSVTNVQFFAGTNPIGTRALVPWSVTWNSAVSGSYVLTAVAADNAGASTLSAPVSISLTLYDNTVAIPATKCLHLSDRCGGGC